MHIIFSNFTDAKGITPERITNQILDRPTFAWRLFDEPLTYTNGWPKIIREANGGISFTLSYDEDESFGVIDFKVVLDPDDLKEIQKMTTIGVI